MPSPLAVAVGDFALAARDLADATLERDLDWRGQQTDVRWCAFAVYSELGDLAATLAVERATRGPAPTVAQRALAGAQNAVRDVQGLLLRALDLDLDQPPAPGEWPLRELLRHMMRGASGFITVLRWTRERARNGEEPARLSEELFVQLRPKDVADGDLSTILDRLVLQHDLAIEELADVTEAELATPFLWWFTAELRFQIFRFDAHLREHTIQAEKLLAALLPTPTDALSTLRLIYGALGEVEGWQIGAPALTPAAVAATTARINAITDSLATLAEQR